MISQDLSVALIGMPAVGKSTVGVLLAKQLGYDFLDTDIVIQTKERMTLSQIIRKRGLRSSWILRQATCSVSAATARSSPPEAQ